MESSESLYSVLKISSTASTDEIRKAFLKLAREFHPDKTQSSETTKKFNDIRQAYGVLSDPLKRKQYDYTLDIDHFFQNPFQDFEINDESMEFRDNSLSSKPPRTSGLGEGSFTFKSTLPKDPPLKKDLFVSLEEIHTGAIKRFKIERQLILSNGLRRNDQKILIVQVLPGWKAGTTATFMNEGDQKPDSISADVIITIRDKEHKYFTRDAQNNLIYNCKLSLKDALICSFIDIPTIDGKTVRIKHDGVIRPGMKTILEGYGLPIPHQANKRADLIITYEIILPQHLSTEQRKVICDSLPTC